MARLARIDFTQPLFHIETGKPLIQIGAKDYVGDRFVDTEDSTFIGHVNEYGQHYNSPHDYSTDATIRNAILDITQPLYRTDTGRRVYVDENRGMDEDGDYRFHISPGVASPTYRYLDAQGKDVIDLTGHVYVANRTTKSESLGDILAAALAKKRYWFESVQLPYKTRDTAVGNEFVITSVINTPDLQRVLGYKVRNGQFSVADSYLFEDADKLLQKPKANKIARVKAVRENSRFHNPGLLAAKIMVEGVMLAEAIKANAPSTEIDQLVSALISYEV